jgi:hypothetical protein
MFLSSYRHLLRHVTARAMVLVLTLAALAPLRAPAAGPAADSRIVVRPGYRLTGTDPPAGSFTHKTGRRAHCPRTARWSTMKA